MGDALQGVGKAMGVVVGGVDAPVITCLMMADMANAVNYRVTHVDVG